jgi:bacillolysin
MPTVAAPDPSIAADQVDTGAADAATPLQADTSAAAATASDQPAPAPDESLAQLALDVGPPACVEPNDQPDDACTLMDGMSVAGFLRAPGDLRAYRFDVTAPEAHVLASLTNLPADYDLYLADASGDVLGESVQEGTVPEFVDVTLPSGTYYLYVDVDPSRAYDPNDPFSLQLTLSVPEPTADNVAEAPPAAAP